jgi:hypothetical protein
MTWSAPFAPIPADSWSPKITAILSS